MADTDGSAGILASCDGTDRHFVQILRTQYRHRPSRCTMKSNCRTKQVQLEAMKFMTDPAVMARMFKKKAWWMPKWIWKIVVGLVIVQ